MYLHELLHCLFCHLWNRKVKEESDQRLWNLAADIAVENVMDDFYEKAVYIRPNSFRREKYQQWKVEHKVLAAEILYYDLLKCEEEEIARLGKTIPPFAPGDTVVVQVKVKEGTRERLQAYEGVVIAKRNRGLNSAFTVRKISNGVGVERTFQTYSPLIDSVTLKRRGDVRKAKLYYLRDLSGKAARIKEKLS